MALTIRLLMVFLQWIAYVPVGLGDVCADIPALTDARTRVVWLQDQGNGLDVMAQGNRLKLMGWDSGDKHGERAIMPEIGSYRKPLITPSGGRIVFSFGHPEAQIHVINWDGTGHRVIGAGMAVDVWQDPATGTDWVYAGRNPQKGKGDQFEQVVRFCIDDPQTVEPVWNISPINPDNFQVSADGSRASGTFPWPAVGVARLPNQSWQEYGKGCWTSLSPDNSYLMWMFDGQHRNLILHTDGNQKSWRVNITGVPDIAGYEVYHPRWSNHPFVFAMTGPYKIKTGVNNIRGGGAGVEVYLGRFSNDMKTVRTWARITRNDKADFFPDAWIEGGEKVTLDRSRLSGPDRSSANSKNRNVPKRIQVHARLLEKSETPDPASIAPYSRALAVYRYEILTPVGNLAAGSKILVAHWVIQDYAVIADFSRTTGQSYRMALEDMASHPDLESERMIQDMDVWDLPLFIDMTR
ncbi:MAG: hypothetical protein AB7S77_07270 [Desulfatirhabdiaceae bacterium]